MTTQQYTSPAISQVTPAAVSGWKSIPTFLRFTAWVAAISYIAGLIAALVVGVFLTSVLIHGMNALSDLGDTGGANTHCPAGTEPAGVTGACAPK